MKMFRCTNCGHIHCGEAPPEYCPVCGYDSSYFEEIEGLLNM